ncbi:hypothetical protein FHY08_004881 [Pseudomonas koreensis]|nr:hypothetical protein [Pseudomonas koreensis]
MQTPYGRSYMTWDTNKSIDTVFVLHSETGLGNALTTHVKYAKWHLRMMNATKLKGHTHILIF